MEGRQDRDDAMRPHFSIQLPEPPAELQGAVKAWEQPVEILTYAPEMPDANPMFLDRRVYQGSSGRTYPLPFIDRIAVDSDRKLWRAIHMENEFLRVMILPEIGGRIHVGYDKRNGYDFFYRQNVIKPALVGLAGPWISGGVEFNWPQHHRPATFMPVTTEIVSSSDGSVTVWCSDHDPMLRMKGMHGICLSPGRAALELRVRLYNRTPFTQTFLWWANVATRVHEGYQSFFPADVRYVADHAKRAVTTFPLSTGTYYGINYGERARSGVPDNERPRMFVPDGSYAANDLSWYANIPVPTSYMIAGSEGDFFGGYDHKADAGVIHVADHHIAPGKKQWTWGNHEFGYAWDRNLTDRDGPYVELMAGVYTDNQPDFSYLAPWETKTFTQTWYPIQNIGVPQAANVDAALSLKVVDGVARIGILVTRDFPQATVTLRHLDAELARWDLDLTAAKPALLRAPLPAIAGDEALAVRVTIAGATLMEYDPAAVAPAAAPAVAKEPAAPDEIESVEELYLTGLHLEQYRHATRLPEPYWREALRRDPNESRAHLSLGLWHLRRGEFALAAEQLEAAIKTLTRLNPNPRDGEPFYALGLTRRYQGKIKEAYDAFYKASWNSAWRTAAYLALAEIDMSRGDLSRALEHVQLSLKTDTDNLQARNLKAQILQRLGRAADADAEREEALALDPLDLGARWSRGLAPANGQECLDLAFDLLRSGQQHEARNVLSAADLTAKDGSVPMLLLTMAHIERALGTPDADATYRRAMAAPLDYCFPSRLEELIVLESSAQAVTDDWRAHYLLGNLLYDKRRYEDAIAAWEAAAESQPGYSVLYRNLGIAYFNQRQDASRAFESFERAIRANPLDARLLYERDQLWKRMGLPPEKRLQELLRNRELVSERDDLSVELATLYNQTGRPDDALNLLLQRRFQPWEGGEGLVLNQYVRARVLRGRDLLDRDEAADAAQEFSLALQIPANLSEARHLLANQSEIFYWLGEAHSRLGDREAAQSWWLRATQQQGDFQNMSVRVISDMTFWTVLAHQSLGNGAAAAKLIEEIYSYSTEIESCEPKIDYFATSLPAMLLFTEDLARRNQIDALFLRAQAQAARKNIDGSIDLLNRVLVMDRNHTGAADLLRQIRRSS